MSTPRTELPLVIDVETTEAERIAAVGAATRRLTAAVTRRSAWLRSFALWLGIGLLVSLAVNRGGNTWLPLGNGLLWVGVLVVGISVFLAWRQRRRLMRRMAGEQEPRYRLRVETDGLHVASEHGTTQLPWSAVEAAETSPDALLVHLRGFQTLSIPYRSLDQAAAREALMTALQERLGASLGAPPARPAPPRLQPAGDRLLADFARNVHAGLLFLALRRSAPSWLRPSVPQLILLLLAQMGLGGAVSLWRIEGAGDFNPDGLLPLFYGIPWLLLAAWAAARAAFDETRTLAAAVALAALGLAASLLSVAVGLLPPEAWRALSEAGPFVWWAPFAWGLLAAIPALVRTAGLQPEQRVGAVLAVIYLLGLPPFLVDRDEPLWIERYDPAAGATARARWEQATGEAVLYSQPRLLQEALDRVTPGRPGIPELFLLAVGGYGAQDVFLREVRAVDALFRERFDTAGHSLVLVNNPTTVTVDPIASVTALSRSLEAIAQRMNPDEDVLFLFMTSHGGRDHRFDLSLGPYRFDDLTPQRLHEMMEAAGIRYRVVVVSACYSGGFVPHLANDDSLVITAARHDRNSHGCSHEAEWTFFGRAFFDEALRRTRSFELAYEQARVAVAEREAAEGHIPSEPQIAVGDGIRTALSAIERRLEYPRVASEDGVFRSTELVPVD